jgi:hypothetical protein
MGFFQSLQGGDLGQGLLVEARSQAEKMVFQDYVKRVGLSAVIANLRKIVGTPALNKAVARPRGQPPRDPRHLLGLWVVVETAKRAKSLDTKAACNLIAKLGGFPRVRDTINPLKEQVYGTDSTIRKLHGDVSKYLLEQGLAVQAIVEDTVAKRIDGFHKSGRSYDAWERHNLLEMKKKYSRAA